MTKIKLSDLIKDLNKIKAAYKKEFGKDPYVWNIDVSGFNEITSIELCHSIVTLKSGRGSSCLDPKEYELQDII